MLGRVFQTRAIGQQRPAKDRFEAVDLEDESDLLVHAVGHGLIIGRARAQVKYCFQRDLAPGTALLPSSLTPLRVESAGMNRHDQLLCMVIGVLGMTLGGCFGPSKANIELRKENQELQQRIWSLERARQGDLQRITALEQPTTVPALPYVELQKLYTAHGLSFGMLTGGYRQNENDEKYAGIVVHVVPTDDEGQTLKAAGRFDVSVFDLGVPEKPLVGHRVYDLEQARAAWNGRAMLFNYVLKVPFTTQPQHPDLLVRVEFTDELTGRKITGEKKVNLSR